MGNLKQTTPGFAWLGPVKALKELVFSSDTGTLTLFTVTGDVIVKILPIIITSLVPNTTANVKLGIIGDTDAIIVDTVSTVINARDIWIDQLANSEIESLDVIKSYIITDSNDIILTLSAQVNSGAISFYCFWTALSVDGKVVEA